MSKQYYYSISVALEPIWQESTYTYKSDKPVNKGTIVIVPFGRDKKVGYVLEQTTEPDFTTKKISIITRLTLPSSSQELHAWMQSFYPGNPGIQLQYILPSLLKTKLPDSIQEKPSVIKTSKDQLTDTQSNALKKLRQDKKPVVLHGITGSGKTRLYSELATPYIKKGQDVLILYPEISLTSQLRQTLSNVFGRQAIATYHSKQAMSAQRKTWLRALDNTTDKGRVFIGPRSSLFLPIKNLGLIILDEAHDTAYKQDSGSRYNGLLVAAALANLHEAKLVLGSATPPIQETHQIVSKNGSIIAMDQLAKPSTTKKDFKVIDMKNKNNRSKKSYLLSKELIQAIESSLQDGQQSLVFLNRRGTARMLLCEECGWHAECSSCDMPLIYHHDSHTTKCHICGQKSHAFTNCPDCKTTLTQRSPGTKAIEQDLRDIFPTATIARFDSDNAKADSFAEQYDQVASGKVDIIIGTQLLTKGLDLPRLSAVGILQADSSLLLPDYTSEERAFQQLVQVSGRVGRGHVDRAVVVLQTYQPTHELFDYIVNEDWYGFYQHELSLRKSTGYPPYSFAMRVWSVQKTANAAEALCQKLASQIKSIEGLRVLGPAPSFYEKRAGKYSWQLIMFSPSRKQLTQVASTLPRDVFYDLDPVSLL